MGVAIEAGGEEQSRIALSKKVQVLMPPTPNRADHSPSEERELGCDAGF
jgi:hypothetical protein